jgi:hypothetical protein
VIGFWSYVHRDDEADGGRITRLVSLICLEYALITGEEIEFFFDRTDIRWGQEWRQRIDAALTDTAFFIPVVTPRYFQSPECRRELLTFAGHAESLGVKELLLPLLYISIDKLDTQDEAVALVMRTQYENWTQLRLEDEASSAYRHGVYRLASRLAEIHERLANELTAPHVAGLPPFRKDGDGEGQDEPGFIDILAAGEAAIPELAVSLTGVGNTVGEIAQLTEAATADIRKSDAAGRGAAGRLVVVRRFANAIAAPSERVRELATDYAVQLVTVDAGILALIRNIDPTSLSEGERVVACNFFGTVRELATSTRTAAEALRAYMATLETTSDLSRDLRRPLRHLHDGIKKITDGESVIDEWTRRIDVVGLDCSGADVTPPTQLASAD